MINAVALYDFIGNEETDELSFKAGDIITILNSESGDGWWEGKLVDGSTGVFPELYVQILSFSHVCACVK